MIVYRIAHVKYIDDREGIGAKLFGGRWNEINSSCLYTSQHISLAFLEKFVHAKAREEMTDMVLIELELPDEKEIILNVDDKKLTKNWQDDIHYTQWIGSQFLEDLSILAFSVPSVLVPFERNYIINTRSSFYKEVRFKRTFNLVTDLRFLSKLL